MDGPWCPRAGKRAGLDGHLRAGAGGLSVLPGCPHDLCMLTGPPVCLCLAGHVGCQLRQALRGSVLAPRRLKCRGMLQISRGGSKHAQSAGLQAPAVSGQSRQQNLHEETA